MSTSTPAPRLRRAVVLMTASSLLVPVVGLVTAPLLARALSPDGRGELAAAMAPATLMLSVATLGLPEALTYYLARQPQLTRPALARATIMTLALGSLSVLATWACLPLLAAGRHDLAGLILVAVLITLPGLVVNVLRGAASGLQRWSLVALERVVVTLWRLVWFVGLFLAGRLTVRSGVLVYVTAALVALVVYLPVLARAGDFEPARTAALGRRLAGFGTQIWFGSVATMLLARVDQLLMVPLASSYQLGLFSVANTVSDVPLIVLVAVQSAVFGVNSRARDAARTTSVSRAALLAGVVGCGLLAAVLPVLVPNLFGADYGGAVRPTLLLLVSACVSIPGTVAAGGLAAWGRPGLRSAGLVVTLAVNTAVFVALVPGHGAVGAGWAALAGSVVMTCVMLLAARRVMGVPARDFALLRRADLRALRAEQLRHRVRDRPGAQRRVGEHPEGDPQQPGAVRDVRR